MDRLPTREALNNRGIELDLLLCPRCGDAVEDVNHALVRCRDVKEVWERIKRWWGKDIEGSGPISDQLVEDIGEIKSLKGLSW